MDWARTELQEAVQDLARQILADAEDPWAALVESELLGELGWLETCTLLVEVGRAGARVPVFETVVLGAPIRSSQHAPALGTVLTAALTEAGGRGPLEARTVCTGGKLFGEKVAVPAIDRAARVVIPAADGLYAVQTADCEVQLGSGTNGDAVGSLVLDGVPAERLDTPVQEWLARVHVGMAALQLGLAKTALAMTAAYVGEREQFGRKIGTFQAVSHRAADAWIDTRAMELTLWQAAWRLEEGLPADREVAVARYWANEGAHRVVAAAQHLHGGMGFDRDYALHRYFLTAKHWEFTLGGASAQLERLGDLLAG